MYLLFLKNHQFLLRTPNIFVNMLLLILYTEIIENRVRRDRSSPLDTQKSV